MITIIKRDNTEEEWSDDKVVTSLIRCELSAEEAKQIVDTLKENIKTSVVKSSEIRTDLIKILSETHPEEGLLYANFQK